MADSSSTESSLIWKDYGNIVMPVSVLPFNNVCQLSLTILTETATGYLSGASKQQAAKTRTQTLACQEAPLATSSAREPSAGPSTTDTRWLLSGYIQYRSRFKAMRTASKEVTAAINDVENVQLMGEDCCRGTLLNRV